MRRTSREKDFPPERLPLREILVNQTGAELTPERLLR